MLLTGVEERQKSAQGGFEIVTKAVRKGRMTVISVEKEPKRRSRPDKGPELVLAVVPGHLFSWVSSYSRSCGGDA